MVPAQACKRHGVAAGTFCFGAPKAAEMASKGFKHVGFEVDTNMVAAAATSSISQLKTAQ